MSKNIDEIQIPRQPRERSIWVMGQLKLKGKSYRAIAKSKDRSPTAARQAMFQPSADMEDAIAEALGLTSQQLFPERFDEDGKRLHATRRRSA